MGRKKRAFPCQNDGFFFAVHQPLLSFFAEINLRREILDRMLKYTAQRQLRSDAKQHSRP